MRNTKMVVCLGVFAAYVGVPSLSIAEDNCSGYSVRVGNTQVTLNNDPSAPDHLAVGTCDQAGCTYKDKDGDVWTEEVGPSTWRTVSGTGKYVNVKNSEWYELKRWVGTPEGMVYVATWGGTCKLN